MEYKDYYKIMGVARNASQEEIKRAYRQLARKYHPDVSKEVDAEKRFKDIGEAYEVLKEPQKRAAYDQLGAQWHTGAGFQSAPGWDNSGFDFKSDDFNDGIDFSDFFESMLHRRTSGSSRKSSRDSGFGIKGKDHRAKINITLEDAYHGVNRAIQLQIPAQDSLGHLHTQSRTLNVKIPKGISAGQQIRLAGQGAAGQGSATHGDLYLEIQFEPHRLFKVQEKDIYLDLPLAPWEAALGAKIMVPTLGGAVEMKVPPNVHPGQKMRLKGRGLPGHPPGDHYVIFQVVTPPANNERARTFYHNMAAEFHFDPRADMLSA
jgi:curved DNA-binding protein